MFVNDDKRNRVSEKHWPKYVGLEWDDIITKKDNDIYFHLYYQHNYTLLHYVMKYNKPVNIDLSETVKII